MLRRLISFVGPYSAALLVLLSMIFPSRDARAARSLRADFDALRAQYDALRSDFVATLDFLRSADFSQVVASADGGGVAGVSSDAAPAALDAPGCVYMRVAGVDGLRCGSDWWLVGESTPWGTLEETYRGGFVADGRRYRSVSVPPVKGLGNEL